ncbi:MAG: RidA family protein [Clostridiales bacterium]|nr:RidA family protein [Clostridiales bacterium]MDY4060112.1 RidA family protein [Anaerovoracaceae bacterium]
MKKIKTENAPKALGPYSQAVVSGNLLFTSGQGGIDPAKGTLLEGLEAQTEQVMKNIEALLKEAGTDFSKVVKTTCFLKDMNDFKDFNEIYGRYFTEKPARSCVAAADLPGGFLVEVEVIAEL